MPDHVTDVTPPPYGTAVVFGASGGIGRALIVEAARQRRFSEVWAGSRRAVEDLPHGIRRFAFDLLDEESVTRAVAALPEPVTLAVVATGVLHDAESGIFPEKSIKAIDPHTMARAFAVNATGPMLIAKHLVRRMPRNRPATFAFLSARVGSIADNRLGGWYAYRASKAALNMLVKSLAVEAARTHPQATIVALHPGTVVTKLSSPFRNAYRAGPGFAPAEAASHLMATIDRLTPGDSGGLFASDAAPIPY